MEKSGSLSPIYCGFYLTKHSNTGVYFPFEWNVQVQNIAFKQSCAMQSMGHVRELQRLRFSIETLAYCAKHHLNFLCLFPSLGNYFAIYLAVYASESSVAARKDCQRAFVQTYIQQEYARPEDISFSDHLCD